MVGERSLFPDDVLSRLLRRLVRSGGLLEPHTHAGVAASLSEVLALGELADAPGMTQAELGELLALEKSTVSRLVVGMERRGWVSRERDEANRRFVRLHLTADGQAVARRIGEHFHSRHAQMIEALTPEELTALGVGLTALARVIGVGAPAHDDVMTDQADGA